MVKLIFKFRIVRLHHQLNEKQDFCSICKLLFFLSTSTTKKLSYTLEFWMVSISASPQCFFLSVSLS